MRSPVGWSTGRYGSNPARRRKASVNALPTLARRFPTQCVINVPSQTGRIRVLSPHHLEQESP